jgi:Host cell surface-exposed lipoprotein
LSACDIATSSDTAGKSHHQAGTKDKPAAPKYTVAQQNAIQSAQNYLSIGSGFSRAGLIQQLTSKAGSGFKLDDAVFAVNHVKVDWNKQAVLSAKNYLSIGTGFSRTGLIQQLTSKAGSGFTLAQATYAANHVGL